ncbi:histone-lysine N-methyltransferase trithorax-like isoform X1 [Schistocerca nitens]|uniref:histone-lysine N-methyltransferase trithorax-like isoform X1 n=1 Tax=Schistocerca nitens TaxID=7011 RepID=UPI002119286A|nr:histone-lysine N-methyltransferase trithorax-like isoform X1 [Schistocerca nitens]
MRPLTGKHQKEHRRVPGPSASTSAAAEAAATMTTRAAAVAATMTTAATEAAVATATTMATAVTTTTPAMPAAPAAAAAVDAAAAAAVRGTSSLCTNANSLPASLKGHSSSIYSAGKRYACLHETMFDKLILEFVKVLPLSYINILS